MSAVAPHHCRVLASPWPGVYATDITSGRHFARHWHAAYGFGLMDDGAHRSASGRGAVEAHAGDIVCANPGEVHDGRPLGAPVRRWRTVYVAPEFVASVQAESGPGAVDVAFTRAAFHDPRMRGAVLQLLGALQAWNDGASPASAVACEEALVQACGRMLRHHSTGAGTSRHGDVALGRVMERLADDSLPAPRLAELAGLAGVGPFQLLRQFRRAFGTTPHAWWLQQRAEAARQRITRGDALVAVALAGGFTDQSHLNRVFVQRFGFTPGAWRRAQAQ